jgi:hypothetical protein
VQLAAARGPDGEIIEILRLLYNELAEHDGATTDLDRQRSRHSASGSSAVPLRSGIRWLSSMTTERKITLYKSSENRRQKRFNTIEVTHFD